LNHARFCEQIRIIYVCIKKHLYSQSFICLHCCCADIVFHIIFFFFFPIWSDF